MCEEQHAALLKQKCKQGISWLTMRAKGENAPKPVWMAYCRLQEACETPRPQLTSAAFNDCGFKTRKKAYDRKNEQVHNGKATISEKTHYTRNIECKRFNVSA